MTSKKFHHQLGTLNSQVKEFRSYVFSTYTYSRDNSADSTWRRTNNDFNRYIQRLRRLHNSRVQYCRTIEAHADGYPHIHAILRFPTVLTVENSRYFDRKLYEKWKGLWRFGHSDYQPPLSRTRSPLLYCIKYVTKGNTTLRTFWKHYFELNPQQSQPIQNNTTGSANVFSLPDSDTDFKTIQLNNLVQYYNIKQLSWSRHFFSPSLDWSPQGGSGGKAQQTLLTSRSK